jgi:Ca2+-binding EF-hand superfamily protein
MFIRKYAAVTLVLIAIASIGVAYAQNNAGWMLTQLDRMKKNFIVADKNKDGALTREEAEAGKLTFVVKHFDDIDSKHTGKVTMDDIDAYLRVQAAAKQQKPEPTPKD